MSKSCAKSFMVGQMTITGVVEFSSKLWKSTACILAVFAASAFNVAAYGSSVEDLVGAFSIQKTIKIGSSSECFSSAERASDALDLQGKAVADHQPPGLTAFGIEPKVGKSSLSVQSINLTAHIIDDQSGLSSDSKANLSAAYFVSSSGKQTASAIFDPHNLTAGSKLDGIYSTKIILPQNSELGYWRLYNLTLIDEQGNRRVLSRDDLARLGFPAQFLVT
jgi:hypothetical protein